MNYFSSDFKLGILGGGQLGKMLLTETRKFDISTFVLDPSKDAPAQFGANKFFVGSLLDYETVYQFGRRRTSCLSITKNVTIDSKQRKTERFLC